MLGHGNELLDKGKQGQEKLSALIRVYLQLTSHLQ